MSKRRSHIKRAKVLRGRRSWRVTSDVRFFSENRPILKHRANILRKRGTKEVRIAQAMRGYYQD